MSLSVFLKLSFARSACWMRAASGRKKPGEDDHAGVRWCGWRGEARVDSA